MQGTAVLVGSPRSAERAVHSGAPPGQVLTQIQSPLEAGDGCHIPLFPKEAHACSSWPHQLSCVLQSQLPARQRGQCRAGCQPSCSPTLFHN